jgi:hypothetical protein
MSLAQPSEGAARLIIFFRVNPGLCQTSLARESNSWGFWFFRKLFARTAEMGSRTLVHAAVGKDGEDWKGEYLSDCAVDEYESAPSSSG